jgi:hypothetical protein
VVVVGKVVDVVVVGVVDVVVEVVVDGDGDGDVAVGDRARASEAADTLSTFTG